MIGAATVWACPDVETMGNKDRADAPSKRRRAEKNGGVLRSVMAANTGKISDMAILHVYCQPGARQTQWVGWHDGRPKLQLRAPPVDGAANKALIEFVAAWLGVPKSRVVLASGQQSRMKKLDIDGVGEAELLSRLPARD